MNVGSDPFLASAERHQRSRWIDGIGIVAVTAEPTPLLPKRRSMFQRVLLRGFIVLALAFLTLHTLGRLLAEPLSTTPNAPLWNVEITSSSSSSVVALAYSRETGIHFLRVPGAESRGQPRFLFAHLARGDLHMMSLGLAGLRASAKGPPSVPLISWSAEGRLITAYQHPEQSGVRTSW